MFFISISIYFSCGNSVNNKDAIARVYDQYLLKSDLIGVVPVGIHGKDSIAIINDYINSWIKKKLVIRAAGDNLSSKQKDFDKQLEDYKN